jgi:exosortase
MNTDPSAPAPWWSLPGPQKTTILILAGFAAALCWILWPAWSGDPDVSHGLLMPVVFLILIARSRRAGPWRFHNGGPAAAGAAVLLAAGAPILLFVAGLYSTAIGWSNALVSFLLATSLTLFLLAGLVVLSDRRVRCIPLNWAAVTAALLWPMASPIPPGTYTRLTLSLQLLVTRCVIHTLHILGIVAIRHGNVIQLANGAVGVEEACSGVRSLVSCVFVGVFLSGALLTRPRGRLLVIALSVPLALGMNFLRSLILTLLAQSGTWIAGRWHDITGFAILLVTAFILTGLSVYLSRHGGDRTVATEPAKEGPAGPPAGQRILAVSLLVATLLIGLFYAHTRPAPAETSKTGPDLRSLLPGDKPGWTVTTSGGIYEFTGLLQTEDMAQRVYRRDGAGSPTTIIVYAAYWRPGQAPVSLVETHTPDACWPGSGWTAQPLPVSHDSLVVSGRTLPRAEVRLFSTQGSSQYVWFWHLYGSQPVQHIDPYSLGRLLRIAWRYGFRNDGSQLFVRVSSNRPWAEISGEPVIRDLFERLRPFGL